MPYLVVGSGLIIRICTPTPKKMVAKTKPEAQDLEKHFREPTHAAARERLRALVERRADVEALTVALLRVSRRVWFWFHHRRLVAHYLRSQPPLKLHLGCGVHRLAGWLNTDLNPKRDVVFLDAARPLPFSDGTYDYVFAEHLLQYLEFPYARRLVAELFRVLKPGGKLRMATTDLQFLVDLYEGRKSDLEERYIRWVRERYARDVNAATDTCVINNFFRGFGHKFIYDYKTIQTFLMTSGFVNIVRRNVGESDDAHLRGIDGHGLIIGEEFNRLETLVVEAIRPA